MSAVGPGHTLALVGARSFSGGQIALLILIAVLVIAGGTVTGLKERWGWMIAGLVTGGVLWIVGAFVPARPGSRWSRWRASRRWP